MQARAFFAFPASSTTRPQEPTFENHEHTTSYGGRTFSGEYSDSSLWATLKRYGAKAGRSLVYSAFVLYYALQSPKCCAKSRGIILGALAYLVLPVDLVPDFLPVVGLADDLVVITTALAKVATCIDDSVREAANAATARLLGEA